MNLPASPSDTAVRSLAAYIPVTLVRQILADALPSPGVSHALNAATLFADISGFTAMSEELAADGPRGAEELNRVLLLTFTTMIDVIHDMGGAVSHFYGDAMSVYFPDEDGTAALRALSCAQMMQQLMLTSLSRIVTNRPPSKPPIFELTIKIGVGYGRCQELIVSDGRRSMEFVLTGTAVDEAAAAEKEASAGEVVASCAVLRQIGIATAVPFQLFQQMLPPPAPQPILDWAQMAADEAARQRLQQVAAAFVPPVLHQRLLTTDAADAAEHRPVASLFVQFQLEAALEETAVMGQQLQAYYEWATAVVGRFGGENARVNRLLTADKGNQLHIIFGAPVAPDAPDQALRCALALQRERPSYVSSQQIGAAVGKVFAGPVGATGRREYTVVGDVVNLSARLTQVCPPGAVWTNEATMQRTSQGLEFTVMPPVQLKGKQTAVVPHQLVGERVASTQLQAYLDRWNRPLFGRDAELATLLAALDGALHGSGGAAALFGPTGAGKSRLVAYGVKHWLDAGGRGLLGVCLQHTSDIPFRPWRTVWQDFFGLKPGMAVDEQVTAVVSKTLQLVPDSDSDVGLWGDALGLPISQAAALQSLTAEARQARFFALVRRCLQAAVAQQPVLIVLEGVQHADASSLALLDDLARMMAGHALFLAVTYRAADGVALGLLERPNCRQIEVADLSAAHARELLKHHVGTAVLPPAVEQHLGLRDREGRDSPVNPLYLEEALNVMLAAGVLRVNGRVQVDEARLAQMQVPDTIHGLLLARLDRLPPSRRDLLQIASVIGRQFALDPLAAISAQSADALVLEMLRDLTAADMTRLVTADPEWVYLFQHAMTHEVAYESLPYARRQSLHAAVAAWIAERYVDNLRPYHPVLAFHYSRADQHSEALRYAMQAADDARAIFANREAVELYTLAEKHLRLLDEAAMWETAVALRLARAETLRLIGDYDLAGQDVDKAIKLAQAHRDIAQLVSAMNLMAEIRYRQNQLDEARNLLDEVVESFGSVITDEERARAYQWSGFVAARAGEHQQALAYLQQAEALCEATQSQQRLARVLEALAFVYFSQKRLETALAAMERSVQLSRDFSVPANVAASLSNIALVQLQLGRPQQALVRIDEAIATVEDVSRNFLARFLGNRAEIYAYLGRFQDASADFEQAIELFTAMEDQQGLIEVYLVYAYECLIPNGVGQRAQLVLQAAQALLAGNEARYPEEHARSLLCAARLALLTDTAVAARESAQQALALVTDRGLAWWRPAALYVLARSQAALGETAVAAATLQQAADAVVSDGCPDYLPLIYLELAQSAETAVAQADYLQQCVTAVSQRARYLDRATCYRAAAALLRDGGESVEAAGYEALLAEVTAVLQPLVA